MVHRKIIDPVLKNLGPSWADYFNRLVARVERDPRTKTVPNLVYLVLRETITCSTPTRTCILTVLLQVVTHTPPEGGPLVPSGEVAMK